MPKSYLSPKRFTVVTSVVEDGKISVSLLQKLLIDMPQPLRLSACWYTNPQNKSFLESLIDGFGVFIITSNSPNRLYGKSLIYTDDLNNSDIFMLLVGENRDECQINVLHHPNPNITSDLITKLLNQIYTGASDSAKWRKYEYLTACSGKKVLNR